MTQKKIDYTVIMTRSYQELIVHHVFVFSLQKSKHLKWYFTPRKFSTSIDCIRSNSPVWAYPKRQSWRTYLTTVDRPTTTDQEWHSWVATAQCQIIATSTWITNIRRRGSSVAIERLLQVSNWKNLRRPFQELIIRMSLPGKLKLTEQQPSN